MSGPVVPCACASQCRAVELELRLEKATELLRQARKSLKRTPFNLLVGIDDFLAGTEASAVFGEKSS